MKRGKVVIRRNKNKTLSGNAASSKTNGSKRKNVKYGQYSKNAKVFSILLFAFSILLFLALVSHSSDDQANTDISLWDLTGLLTGDDHIMALADKTSNWLGLVGAFTAEFVFNKTFGYVMIFLPWFLFLAAKRINKYNRLTEDIIKKFLFFLVFSLFMSGFFGTLKNISWFDNMSVEWFGAGGAFISSLVSGVISTAGAFIFFLACVVSIVMIGTDIDFSKITNSSSEFLSDVYHSVYYFFQNLFSKKSEDDLVDEHKKVNVTMETTQQEKTNGFNINYHGESGYIPENRSNSESPPQQSTDQEFIRQLSSKRSISEEEYLARRKAQSSQNDPDISDQKSRKGRIVYPKTAPDKSQGPVSSPDEQVNNVNRPVKKTRFEDVVNIKPEQPKPKKRIRDFFTNISKKNEPEPNIIPAEDYDKFIEKDDSHYPPVSEQEIKENQNIDDDFFSETPEETTSPNVPVLDEKIPEPVETEEEILPKETTETEDEDKPSLVVTVNEKEIIDEETDEPDTILGTKIHDEDISYRMPGYDLLIRQEDISNINDQELKDNAQILQ